MAIEGTPFRRLRMDEDLWERFGEAVARIDPESNRSANLRNYVRWLVGDTDEAPRRPDSPAVPKGAD